MIPFHIDNLIETCRRSIQQDEDGIKSNREIRKDLEKRIKERKKNNVFLMNRISETRTAMAALSAVKEGSGK